MADPLGMDGVILAIILGTLAGIVYSLRVLVLVERRISRIDINIESLTKKILEQEIMIEAEEEKIESGEKRLKKEEDSIKTEEDSIASKLGIKRSKPSKAKASKPKRR